VNMAGSNTRTRILVLGANGQVGHALHGVLAPLGEVVVATRDGRLVDGRAAAAIDLEDSAALVGGLDAVAADVIVNAAAWTAVDRAEDEPERADRINHRAVGEIGGWAQRRGALVIHYSTDYVFDGTARRPYREQDPTAPLGAYGRSKRDGEEALRASGAAHVILRTAWVYGPRGGNFLCTMLRLAGERDRLRVVADQIGSPTPAPWIADITARILAHWCGLAGAERASVEGTYHLTTASHTSWHGFAESILRGALRRGLITRMPVVEAIPAAEYPTRARRPAWSVLDTGKLALVFGLHLPTWERGLDAVLDELARNRGETG